MSKEGSTNAGATIAVIGTGWWATFNHIPALEQNPSVKRIIAVDKDQERLKIVADKFQIDATYTDVEAMLEQESVDGVVVSSPHTAHFACAKPCLQKGIPCIIEKPLTADIKQARELVSLAESNNTFITMPHGWNFAEFTHSAKALVSQGKIGQVSHVVCQMASPLADLFNGEEMVDTESHLFRPPTSTWSDPNNAGGYGWGQLTHALGLLFEIADLTPADVIAKQTQSKAGVDYYDAAIVSTNERALVSLSGASTMPKHKGFMLDIRIFGTEGVLTVDIERPRVSVFRHDGQDEEIELGSGATDYDGMLPIHHFVDLCSGDNGEIYASGTVGMKSVAVLDAMYRSFSSGKTEGV
ncbi:oxidoreductase domain protein [Vibrio nigripulchritudo ATCC 27043]|uniref:Gfo/Idh/MocA family protein n=1 Tax=Vibrio nigripulchritudo TaxID=28173 RepID=UPI00021C110B|nr:Gfo/Idh/MocA family oxidoreductase [Vibrio nigripulchritudo]EGU60032.1 oxidoreductase domain protein [Vibrio nigripulchritudo ATCC 27043]